MMIPNISGITQCRRSPVPRKTSMPPAMSRAVAAFGDIPPGVKGTEANWCFQKNSSTPSEKPAHSCSRAALLIVITSVPQPMATHRRSAAKASSPVLLSNRHKAMFITIGVPPGTKVVR